MLSSVHAGQELGGKDGREENKELCFLFSVFVELLEIEPLVPIPLVTHSHVVKLSDWINIKILRW